MLFPIPGIITPTGCDKSSVLSILLCEGTMNTTWPLTLTFHTLAIHPLLTNWLQDGSCLQPFQASANWPSTHSSITDFYDTWLDGASESSSLLTIKSMAEIFLITTCFSPFKAPETVENSFNSQDTCWRKCTQQCLQIQELLTTKFFWYLLWELNPGVFFSFKIFF